MNLPAGLLPCINKYIMATSLSKPVQQNTKKQIAVWLSSENLLLTTFMEGTVVTNAKMLSLIHGILAACWLLRSLYLGYPVMGICILWFILAMLLCCKVK